MVNGSLALIPFWHFYNGTICRPLVRYYSRSRKNILFDHWLSKDVFGNVQFNWKISCNQVKYGGWICYLSHGAFQLLFHTWDFSDPSSTKTSKSYPLSSPRVWSWNLAILAVSLPVLLLLQSRPHVYFFYVPFSFTFRLIICMCFEMCSLF